MKRKILYVSGTRADFGFMEPVLRAIQNHPLLEAEVIVTGMHLMKDFGCTGNDVKKSGFTVHEVEAVFDESSGSILHFFAEYFKKAPEIIHTIAPDIVLVAGDRAEMIATAIVASYSSIPLAHVSGGDVTSTIDEHIRHSITKMAQIHFPYTEKSADRIFRMGEDSWRIFTVGSPGVEAMLKEPRGDQAILAKIYGIDPSEPYCIVLQHPVTLEIAEAAEQMRITLSAVEELDIHSVIIYPNADSGGKKMITVIEQYSRNSKFHIFKSIPRKDFLNLMRNACMLIGNSSSGIVEAASYKLPVINIGSRQDGRERGENVVDAGYSREEILSAIRCISGDPEYQERLRNGKNPYEKPGTAEKIAEVLATIPLDHNILQKHLRY